MEQSAACCDLTFSSDCLSDQEEILKSSPNMITIHVSDTSTTSEATCTREATTQTEAVPPQSSCQCALVIQKIEKVLEAMEMSSELAMTSLDMSDLKQRCEAIESQLIWMVSYPHVCTYTCLHVGTLCILL